jgi:hypothetical protein
MKRKYFLAVLILSTSAGYAQSSVISGAGTNIDFGTGTDVSADTVLIGGTFSGSGTRNGQSAATVAYPLLDRWNMLSVALSVNDFSETGLYPSAFSAAFDYQDSYAPQAVLANGKGYWLKFASASTVTITGTPIDEDTIPVTHGWNLIGSISTPIATSSITSIPPGLATSSFFGYTTSYVVTDTIEPGKAYWVKLNLDGKLILTTRLHRASANAINIVRSEELPPPIPVVVDFRHPSSNLPSLFALEQNHPNPFNPVTAISYALPVVSRVRLTVSNALGEIVGTLVDNVQSAGYHQATFDGATFPSGLYFYRLDATDISGDERPVTLVKKMLLLR